MTGDHLTYLCRSQRTGVCCSFDRGDIPSDYCSDQPSTYLLPPYKFDVGGLGHGIGRFDHSHQSARLNHTQCLAHLKFTCNSRTCNRSCDLTKPFHCPPFLVGIPD